MINLLPPADKESVIFARRNRMLVKWLVSAGVGIVGIVAVILFGYLHINQSARVFADQVNSTKQQLATQKLDETQKRIESISNGTKLALQVLSRQVLFSELLGQIGSVMPPGSALQSFTVGKLEGGIDLQAVAESYETATQVQVNLADPENKIFEKADIINISCSTPAETEEEDISSRYPCQVTIRALFAKDSPFLFANSGDKE